MLIVYDSQTGNGETFARKVGDQVQSIDLPVNEPCILITRNEGYGQIARTTQAFLEKNSSMVSGVVVNGMKRFGPFYNKAAKKIEKRFGLEIIAKIELSGSDADVQTVRSYIEKLESV